MRAVEEAYTALLRTMAAAAGALMVAMMTAIVTDVTLRTLGTQSSAHLFTFTEYALLLIPLLGAPWLVREKGHVYVEIFLMMLHPRARAAAMQLIALFCAGVCFVLAWFGGEITVQNFLLSDKDVRSFDMPRWMLMAFMPLSFAMMAIEFLRLFVRRETLFGSDRRPAVPERGPEN